MRIDYNVLWFENEEGWLKPTQTNIARYLEDLGFILKVNIQKDHSNVEAILEEMKNNVYDVDVIFMDYRLAKEEKGDKIIEEIRKTELYTEIVFYSQNTNVKEVIEKGIGSIEGIYYSERDTFLDKVKTVIKHSIKKVQEVNTMRGLVLAAESDLAEKMFDIIEKIVSNPVYGETIHQYVFKICSESVGSKQKNFDAYAEKNDYNSLINDTLIFDSHKKSRVIQKIIKLFNANNDNTLAKYENFATEYNKDVLQPRNVFGHVTPTVSEGKKVLKPKRGDDIVFNDEACIKIRQQLITYSETIEFIQNKILPKTS